jgi:hypothetical protein
MPRGWYDGNATTAGERSALTNVHRPSRRGVRRLTAVLAAALLLGTTGPLIAHSSPTTPALTAGDTVDLRVLLIGGVGGTADPTTAAWAAGLSSQGVAYTEVDGVGSPGAETAILPALTSSATHGLYNGVVFAGKPGDFAAGQFTNLFAYEAAFGIRQLDGNFVPAVSGTLGLIAPTAADPSTGAGISTTVPVPALTTAGLATFGALAGPVPMDTGAFGAPDAVLSPLPTGATETPLLTDAAGNVLIGIYQHPTAAQAPTDPQAGVSELTVGFNYNQFMTQWLLLGPGLIDWVTGAAHVGLYRNYSTVHIDDMFTPDDTWDITTHANNYDPAAALRMRPVDVDNEATWSRTNNFRLDNLFNGGNSTTNNVETPTADALLAEFQKTDPATGRPYTQDFGWLNHTWDHAYLDVGCATTNYVEAEVQQNTNWAASAPGATPGTGGLGLVNSTDNSLSFGTQNPTTLVPGGHSGFANALLGPNDAVDPPNLDDEAVNLTGGTLAAGTYQWALTDQFNQADPTSSDESSASVTDPIVLTAGQTVTLSWGGVCHAANYRIYREVAGSNVWSLVGSVTPGLTATPPATVTADPTGGSTTNTTGGGMQEQTFTDTGAAATAVPGWEPPTTQDAHELPWEQNANFLTAMQALNMTSVGTDASKPYPNPADTQFGIGVNYSGATFPANAAFPDGTFEGVPRHPINIFYNNSTQTQAVDEYNTIYLAVANGGGCVNTSTTTCLTTAATFASIVASVQTGMFSNMVNNDPRPTYVHQTNIMGTPAVSTTNTAIGSGLLYSVLDPLLAEYHAHYNTTAPIQQPTMGAIGTILNEQSAWATAQPPGTASTANAVTATQTGGNIVITNTGATTLTVPVTVPIGWVVASTGLQFGSQYGGALSGWQTLTAGQSITISALPAAVTSAATANAQVGSPFNFTVTTSGAPIVSVTETEVPSALPAGLTFTPNATNGTATITGTPAAGTGGMHLITFTATNVAGPATQAFSLFVADPKITVAASTNPPTFAKAGTPLTANYLVTNTGNVALTSVGVTDALPGLPAISCPQSTLAVGADETCTALYVATQADVDAGGINLAATASGTAPSTTVVQGTSNVTTPAHQGPAIAVTPSSNPVSFFGAGTKLAMNYLVTNSGNVTLHGIGVTDALHGLSAISCPSPTLAPAATEVCTASYTTKAADVKARHFRDSPSAFGTPPRGSAVHGPFKLVVPLWVKPKITSAKLTTVPRQTRVNFTFTATGIPAPAWTLTGQLPKGLSFKAGKLSGTVNAAGLYPVRLTATSRAGTTHKSYTLHVTAPELASNVLAQPGDSNATVTWDPPVLHGGLPVTGYVITPFLGHVALPAHRFHSTATQQVIGRLQNGHTYTFKVAVVNRLGVGPSSLTGSQLKTFHTGPLTNRSPAIKIGAPTAPAVVNVAPNGAGALTVQYSPANGNGAAVTGYTVVCVSHDGGAARSASADAGTLSVVVSALTAGKTYKCSVTASNQRGTGPPATSTPIAV